MISIDFINHTGGLNYSSGIVSTFVPVIQYHIKKQPNGSYHIWLSNIYYAWECKYSYKFPVSYTSDYTYEEVNKICIDMVTSLIRKQLNYLFA